MISFLKYHFYEAEMVSIRNLAFPGGDGIPGDGGYEMSGILDRSEWKFLGRRGQEGTCQLTL